MLNRSEKIAIIASIGKWSLEVMVHYLVGNSKNPESIMQEILAFFPRTRLLMLLLFLLF